MAEEKAMTKLKDLTPEHKQVNVLAKVLEVGESKEIPSKFGKSRMVAEATVGDDTATIILSLWQEQIGSVTKDDIISIDNGFVSLVRGRMRLNVGKYGKIEKSKETLENVNTETDMSAKEYPQEPRSFQRRSFGGGGGRGGRNFGDRREPPERERRALRF